MNIRSHTNLNRILEWVIAHEDFADAILIVFVLPIFFVTSILLFLLNGDAAADQYFAILFGSALLALGIGGVLLSQVSREKREGRANVGSRSTQYIYRSKSPVYFKIAIIFKIGGGLFTMALGLAGLIIFVAECHQQGRFPPQPPPTHVRAATFG